MINKIRNYAPYVYLNRQKNGNGYDLYILVPVEAGKTVQFPLLTNFSNNNNETTIQAKVLNGTQNIIEVDAGRFAKKYYSLNNLNDVTKITIFVQNGNTSNYRNTCLLEDADDFYIDIRMEGLATNSPYTYLAKVNDTFYPRMLLPISETIYTSTDERVEDDTSDVTVVITLQKASFKTAVNIVVPNKINNSGFVDEKFESIDYVVLVDDDETLESITNTGVSTPPETQKKRKGKKRKAEADTE